MEHTNQEYTIQITPKRLLPGYLNNDVSSGPMPIGFLFFVENISIYNMGLDVRKPVFGGLRTTQAQTSLRIRAV